MSYTFAPDDRLVSGIVAERVRSLEGRTARDRREALVRYHAFVDAALRVAGSWDQPVIVARVVAEVIGDVPPATATNRGAWAATARRNVARALNARA